MDDRLELELWRGDDFLAAVEGERADAIREILHYMAVNGQDGGGMRVVEIMRVPFNIPDVGNPSLVP
jgi:hypothetical protein